MTNGLPGGAVRPTLFLGLGGTGKEVLLRMRRKFYEKFGRTGLPCTKYLWIDTDTRNLMAQGEEMDEILRAVSFANHEKLGLLEGRVGEHMSGIYRNRSQWRHIHDWLYQDVERFGTEIADGAGGVRAVGRLSFFFHFGGAKGVLNHLKSTLGPQQLGSQEVIDRTEGIFRRQGFQIPQDIQFVPDPQVFLICSVAGGTGAGIFLDMAFLLKHLKLTNRTYATIFLPNVYYPTAIGEVAERSHGNGYAALKELEFYTMRRREPGNGENSDEGLSVDFEVEWEVNQKHAGITGPPIAVTYLLESNNEGGIGLQNRKELFEMAAESLFLDFMPGSFSQAKRSKFSNVTQYLSGIRGVSVRSEKVILTQTFARRYASFGMSKLEIPVDLLKGACGAQLGHDIVHRVWGRPPLDTNVRAAVMEDMRRGERTLTEAGFVERFGNDWKKDIQSRLERIFRTSTLEEPEDVAKVVGELEEFERRTLRSEGTDSTRWGSAIDQIRRQTKIAGKQLKEDLAQWLARCCDDSGRGPRALFDKDGYLQHLVSNLKELYEFDEDRKPTLEKSREKAVRDAELWKRSADQTRREFMRTLDSWALRGLGERQWTIDQLRAKWMDAQQQMALATAYTVLYEEAKTLAREAVSFLEDQVSRLRDFVEALDTMSVNFQKRARSFLDFGDNVLFIRVFDQEKDWPEFYWLGKDDKENRKEVDPLGESKNFLRGKLGGDVLWKLVAQLEVDGPEGIENDLMAYCEQRFITDFHNNPRQVEVLEHPSLRNRLDEVVNKMVRCALPMVRQEAKLGAGSVTAERYVYLGIANQDKPVYRSFIERLTQQLQTEGYSLRTPDVLPTGRPSEVYLHLVCYAFPLPALKTVKSDLHSAYYSFYRSLREGKIGEQRFQIPLHLSDGWEGKFEDLVVYTDQEAKDTREAMELLLFGSTLRVVELKAEKDRIDYGYRYWIPPASKTKNLGNRREAVDSLRSDSRLRQAMLKEVARRENDLTDAQRERYFWLLSFLQLSELVPAFAPEYELLTNRLSSLESQLSRSHPPENLKLERVDPSLQADEALRRLGEGNFSRIGRIPVLNDLQPWVFRKGE